MRTFVAALADAVESLVLESGFSTAAPAGMMRVLILPLHPGTDAAMANPTPLLLLLSIAHAANREPDATGFSVPSIGPELDALIAEFRNRPITPATAFEFERRLQAELRKYGQKIVAAVYNAIAAQVDAAADHARYDGEDYRRLAKATRNQHVATLFGTITLTRHAYRCTRRDAGEPCLFPAEMTLGLTHGATPAFAEAATRYLAEAGATQAAVLARLRDRHGVHMGAKRLRKLAADRAAAVAESQTSRLADRVIDLLGRADASRGRHKPVLSVGRDGVTMRDYRYRFFECAGVATLAVLDRRGKRLGTVYLGCVPESQQTTLSQRLTAVIDEVLRRWQGPMPRLCYVTDAGDNETKYYKQVLQSMRHPRTQACLKWQRVIDFYHTMERVWKMAEVMFGANTRAGSAWAHRMGKLLKKPNGPFRVLHAAAAMRTRRKLSKTRQAEFAKAYNYIRLRTKWMQYHEYARHKLPLGSGVTEAACKTLVTQRLKLSGMRWTKDGAQVILDLRAALLSETWEAANQDALAAMPQPHWLPPDHSPAGPQRLAA
jgi:hypothetical protein